MPTNSYLGDYQILKGTPTFFVIKAISDDGYQFNENAEIKKSYAVLNKDSTIMQPNEGIFSKE